MTKDRTQYDATGQGDVEMAVMRSRQLKEWIDGAVKERQEIAEKLDVTMAEHGADALVLSGVQVARIDEYDTDTVTGDQAKAMKAKHPVIWKRFNKIGHVRKVVVS